MSDYISKSAIVDRLSEEAKRLAEIAIHSKGQAADYYTGRKTGFAKAAIIANGFPTIDAVPVVRCKECKHSELWYSDRRRCFLWCETGNSVWDDGYCSYGERRENGET